MAQLLHAFQVSEKEGGVIDWVSNGIDSRVLITVEGRGVKEKRMRSSFICYWNVTINYD